MRFYKTTGIGRFLDPQSPTNIAVVLVSIIVAVIFGLWTLLSGSNLIDAVMEGFRASITLFLGWALAREYDPDHPHSAFVAAFSALALYIAGFQANFVYLAFLLIMLRYINRTTGVAATIVDLGVGFALTGWLTWSFDWIVGILAAAAYTIDGFKTEKKYPRFAFAVLSLGLAIAAIFFTAGGIGFSGIKTWSVLFTTILILLGLPLFLSYTETKSLGDFSNEKLDPSRIRWAQAFYLGSILVIALKLGLQESGVAIPAGVVSAAAGVYYLLSLLIPQAKTN